MKPSTRFIQSVVATARTSEIELPWARGARRQAFIAKRKNAAKLMRRSA